MSIINRFSHDTSLFKTGENQNVAISGSTASPSPPAAERTNATHHKNRFLRQDVRQARRAPDSATTKSADQNSGVANTASSFNKKFRNPWVGDRIPHNFTDKTMTLLDHFPHPDLFPKPVVSQQGLDDILNLWEPETKDGKFSWIQFDHDLVNSQGLTRPVAPTVGPPAFNDSLKAVSGLLANGDTSIKLSEKMISLNVAIVAAHENTHANQYESYNYIDREAHKNELERLPIQIKGPIFSACMEEMSTMESLAYHSEVINLTRYRTVHKEYLQQHPDEMLQLNELLHTSVSHRDIHFARLPEMQRCLYLKGDIAALLAHIHQAVPKKFIVKAKSAEPL